MKFLNKLHSPFCLLIAFIVNMALNQAFSQVVPFNKLVKIKPDLVENYILNVEMSSFLIRMPFASDSFMNPGVLKQIRDKQIVQIDLVYTDYRQVKSFDQPELNANRYEKLFKLAPELFNNSVITFKAVSQTGCGNPEACGTFFHGFVLYYNPILSGEERVKEYKTFESAFTKEVKIDTVLAPIRKCIRRYYIPKSKRRQAKGITYSRPGRRRILVREYDTLERYRFVHINTLSSVSDGKTVRFSKDTSVLAALNRNEQWDNMQIVIDVTGSMGPYMEQVVEWIALQDNLKRVNDFVFFQDGDRKSDNQKVPGKTKGIYHVDAENSAVVYDGMKAAMSKGGGGDAPENDVEAILAGIQANPDAKEIILIADNLANMRDYHMIYKIGKPVRVIVCGNYGKINAQYLDLAYATKGSIHTMDEDLDALYKLNEGQEIEIGNQTYLISGGKFKLIY